MTRKPWDEDKKQLLADMLKAGKPHQEIADILGVTRGAVSGAACRLGITVPKLTAAGSDIKIPPRPMMRRTWTDEKLAILTKRITDNVPHQDIADELQMSRGSISGMACRLGLTTMAAPAQERRTPKSHVLQRLRAEQTIAALAARQQQPGPLFPPTLLPEGYELPDMGSIPIPPPPAVKPPPYVRPLPQPKPVVTAQRKAAPPATPAPKPAQPVAARPSAARAPEGFQLTAAPRVAPQSRTAPSISNPRAVPAASRPSVVAAPRPVAPAVRPAAPLEARGQFGIGDPRHPTPYTVRSVAASRSDEGFGADALGDFEPRTRNAVQFPHSSRCCWPFGDPLKDGFHFCGAAIDGKSSYCREHRQRSVVPARKMKGLEEYCF